MGLAPSKECEGLSNGQYRIEVYLKCTNEYIYMYIYIYSYMILHRYQEPRAIMLKTIDAATACVPNSRTSSRSILCSQQVVVITGEV